MLADWLSVQRTNAPSRACWVAIAIQGVHATGCMLRRANPDGIRAVSAELL